MSISFTARKLCFHHGKLRKNWHCLNKPICHSRSHLSHFHTLEIIPRKQLFASSTKENKQNRRMSKTNDFVFKRFKVSYTADGKWKSRKASHYPMLWMLRCCHKRLKMSDEMNVSHTRKTKCTEAHANTQNSRMRYDYIIVLFYHREIFCQTKMSTVLFTRNCLLGLQFTECRMAFNHNIVFQNYLLLFLFCFTFSLDNFFFLRSANRKINRQKCK